MTEACRVTPAPIRVLVVDDDAAVRGDIVAALARHDDMVVIGEAADGDDAITKVARHRPDIALLDPRAGVLESIRQLRADAPSVQIVLLAAPGDPLALQARAAGAAGTVLKDRLRKDLPATIRAVHGGRRAIVAEIALQRAGAAEEERLSEREIRILSLVAEGQANKQIAWQLALSIDTIKAHLKTIFAKLDVADRTHAVVTAARRGFLRI
ncbi:response regulator transcription factor [Sphingosinicella sp. BN140058]|uniref:response regulator transcription factor n=1 Tax=Sphingosinicella sp. BN140058 TaxID=1892855 RepID=UPI001FB057C2|nr:response regulator transcription factor [Sphingosinicella sp. BN140058]